VNFTPNFYLFMYLTLTLDSPAHRIISVSLHPAAGYTAGTTGCTVCADPLARAVTTLRRAKTLDRVRTE
jgi:hypothetical protein